LKFSAAAFMAVASATDSNKVMLNVTNLHGIAHDSAIGGACFGTNLTSAAIPSGVHGGSQILVVGTTVHAGCHVTVGTDIASKVVAVFICLLLSLALLLWWWQFSCEVQKIKPDAYGHL